MKLKPIPRKVSAKKKTSWVLKEITTKKTNPWVFKVLITLLVLAYSGLIIFGGFTTGLWYGPKLERYLLNRGLVENRMAVKTAFNYIGGRVLDVPQYYMKNLFQSCNLEKIDIEINLDNFNKLAEQREEILKDGSINHEERECVPAVVHYQNRSIKVKLGLKADTTDYTNRDKWPFHIYTRGEDHIFGMKAFSLEAPHRKGYQHEILFHEHARSEGILAPRYFFVMARVNGQNMGIMAVEELFAKESLEAQKRTDGVIVRMDESLFCHSYALNNNYGVYENYMTAMIKPCQYPKVEKPEQIVPHLETATGLLRGFFKGYLSACDVFDLELMGRFLALTEIWNCHYPLQWTNLQFYYNPVSAKLEPISNEINCHLQAPKKNLQTNILLVPTASPFTSRLMEDGNLRAHYIKNIRRITQTVLQGDLISRFQELEKPYLDTLRSEFFTVAPFYFNRLAHRAQALNQLNEENYKNYAPCNSSNNFIYPKILHAFLQKGEKGDHIELVNLVDVPIKVTSIYLKPKQNEKAKIDFPTFVQFPVVLKATVYRSEPKSVYIPSHHMLHLLQDQFTIEVVAQAQGQDQPQIIRAEQYYAALTKPPIPSVPLKKTLQQCSFLQWDDKTNTVIIKPGTWEVKDAIILPPAIGLTIEAGTTLKFAAKASIITYSALNFIGTKNRPIKLEALNKREGWPGVVVLNSEKSSYWSYVNLQDMAGHNLSHWSLDGAVTFYNSYIVLQNCVFSDTKAETACSIIGSRFSMTDTSFQNTHLDAVEASFCDGIVFGGKISETGRNGFNLSGSKVKVHDINFSRIQGKALCVGEASQVYISDITIKQCGTGIASNDSSIVEISQSELEEIQHIGFLTYMNKKGYGCGSYIKADEIVKNSRKSAMVRTNSSIMLNGVAVPTQELDVTNLNKEGYTQK